MRFLVTGTAGFIGFHLAQRLLADGHSVLGIDGVTPYYDPNLKRRRHQELARSSAFVGREAMIEDAQLLAELVAEANADMVFHLAAQAGVRYSAENPRAYIESNIVGTFNLLEALRQRPPRHLLIASTSSVYGAGRQQPFEEAQDTDHPVSLYAATKKSIETIAYSYANLNGLPMTVMRLFTVYGPWGRPDMALFKFTRNIIAGEPIEVYAAGKQTRDFTYVGDVVEAMVRLAAKTPEAKTPEAKTPEAKTPEAKTPEARTPEQGPPYRVVNVGGGRPVGLDDFIAIIEEVIGRKALRRELPMQPGDVPATWASTTLLEQITGFRPAVPLSDGVRAFVAWYREYYGA